MRNSYQKKYSFLAKSVMSYCLAGLSFLSLSQSSKADESFDRYYCRDLNGAPTTYMVTPRVDIPLISWYTLEFGEQWFPAERCATVVEALQAAYDADEHIITSGRKNGLNIICSTTHVGGDCKKQLFTIPKKDDVFEVMRTFEGAISGLNSSILINTPHLRSDVPSDTGGWNGEENRHNRSWFVW